MTTILRNDEDRESRQVSIIDARGNGAAFTGSKADECKGHIVGENHVAAGNMLANVNVLAAMSQTFTIASGDLADNLMNALAAGQMAGGDKRGKVSAALYVVTHKNHPYVDLRIDKSKNPVDDLRRLYAEYKLSFLQK